MATPPTTQRQQPSLRNIWGLFAILVVCAVAAGMHRRSVPVEQMVQESGAQESSGHWHVVQRGDNLRSLARFYYGSARSWRTLQIANDVDLYPVVGQQLWIPGHWPESALPELRSTAEAD